MRFLSYYFPNMPYRVVYMMQQHEYNPRKFWAWIITIPDISSVVNRGKLVKTNKAILMSVVAYVLYITCLAVGITSLASGNIVLGFVALVFIADITIGVLFCLLVIGDMFLRVRRAPLLRQASSLFAEHKGMKIAVLGSYGKTSMKEMLATVLSHKFKVAVTPGNKNVPISHARWSLGLQGDEDIIVLEYGEGEPGDIVRLAKLTHPDMAVLTGVAPNHLDEYKTIDALETDFASIAEFIPGDKLFVNEQATGVIERLPQKAKLYSLTEVDGWKVQNIKVSISGVSFLMKRGTISMKIRSELLGEHNVGPLAAVASIAYQLGMSTNEIESAIAQTKPFEHRMQPRLIHGAWLIDDTYNGNFEGFKAGLRLLSQLDAKRKIYVTPGLVDQGQETERVHEEVGIAIAQARPDKVVLMNNRNTAFIQRGLQTGGYDGEVITEDDPLSFYTNIEQFVAAGDVVLMQNDLPDAYA